MAWSAGCCLRHVFVLISLVVICCGLERCEGSGTFGFDVHHISSDRVKEILAVDWLPDKDSLEYYRLMVRRDRRRLGSSGDQVPVSFAEGNDTLKINNLGFLHYVNVTVGTPAKWFLVALDTGSDLFWLPCDCGVGCVRDLEARTGRSLPLNIYSPRASSTSSKVPCNSSKCELGDRCSSSLSDCPYQVRYLSEGTSTTGVLVEDVLHLVTEDGKAKDIGARVTLGCGQVQTGDFLTFAAVNGLFGLGLEDVSVPSILAESGITSDSFSMCFGLDRTGRITFGDKGSSDQQETPILPMQRHPTYNISITQFIVDDKTTDVDFTAIFDTGTSFTYLMEPQYTLFTKAFHSLVGDKQRPPDPDLPFEYCYDVSAGTGQDGIKLSIPTVNLTMKDGAQFSVILPVIVFHTGLGYLYCLTVVKEDFNIIGQNFMTGYKVVFDREKMVLGWKPSDCDSDRLSTGPSSVMGPSGPMGPSGAPEAPTSRVPLPPTNVRNPSPGPEPDLDPRATNTSGGTGSSSSSSSSPSSPLPSPSVLALFVTCLLGFSS